MRLDLACASTVLALAAAAPAAAADCTQPTPITFRKGMSATEVAGGMIRGEEVCYTLAARAGQTLSVTIRSPDQNVVTTIYRPGYTVSGDDEIAGKALRGAAEEDDAQSVRAKLPATGTYLFSLGTSRGGGGEYRMRVSVR